ncbi:NADPH-dependent 7-cyano-7-deazaguanine reductase QueF [Pseudocolwellia sp. AS88]|uniref:NADPH-dependent 7-cyano-7-deazaguanine reductase QueF n=1 Tax=Pseudocolwellia sp. AS88 TaxID=3063958 RepID=UPI0026EB4D11|nr:NADPH-dependent 7-cyano-7-deazaguanine reductase QueF [Pseudocolwellia sp. AS88]MDO7084575.1 NADPH-dependent 7-cyano-7-deazaguanine reductase QueF [Pseudocolwellia sp. AS88]
MTLYKNSIELNGLSLGKPTEYCSEYNPSLLQAVPRSLNRDGLGIKANDLKFKGEDVWYGYELSWLNSKGKPIVAVAEFRFDCTSPNIVESKSFKLYLNSFNQSKFSNWDEVEQHLTHDLSQTSGTQAKVSLFKVDECEALAIAPISASCIDELDVSIETYEIDSSLLALSNTNQQVENKKLISHLLKSNCLITNQPDWASVYITYSGSEIDEAALLRYLISFRQHNEFHEQCVERIFTDIMATCKPDKLSVFARYTRRGGLDINPYRSTETSVAPALRTLRQ